MPDGSTASEPNATSPTKDESDGGDASRFGRLQVPGRLRRWWPAVLLLAFVAWGWWGQDLVRSIPNYDDALEIMSALSWFDDALRSGHNLSTYPLAFYPGGWRLVTFPEGILMLLALLPLQWLGGAAFAFNISVLLTFVLSFAGAFLLARRFVDALPAAMAALLISFWSLRWFQTIGHPNMLLGSALLPWMLLLLDQALCSPHRRTSRLALVGLLWALGSAAALYFVWLGGLAVGGWVVGRLWGRDIGGRTALLAVAIPAAVALALCAPLIYATWAATASIEASFYTIEEVSFWGASLNSLPLPSLDHPLLGGLSRELYRGAPYEQGFVNLGPLAVVLAIYGFLAARRHSYRLPMLTLTLAGLGLALGLTLKWNGEPLQWPLLQPLYHGLWRLGHLLKPGFFTTPTPPTYLDGQIPLPGLLLTILVPFFERARVFARYAFVGGIGLFLLTAVGLMRVRRAWLRLALAALLMVEVLPAPLSSVPFPPASHPSFDWLRKQSKDTEASAPQSVLDVAASSPHIPILFNSGAAVWATRAHGYPAVAGASSVWPGDNAFLFHWLASHPHGLRDSQLAPVLRFYDVRWVLLHMRGQDEQGLYEDALQNPELRPRECFDPTPGASPWPYPICILEVLPSSHPNLNLALDTGWSGVEPWGVWTEGTRSEALWVGVRKEPHRLQVQAFPMCVPGQNQRVALVLNGAELATHTWSDCEPWSDEIMIPADQVRLGENRLEVISAYAARPVDVTRGQNPDPRALSIGFITLTIQPLPERTSF